MEESPVHTVSQSLNIIARVPSTQHDPSITVSTTHRHEKGLKSYMDMPAGYGNFDQ